MKIKREMYLQKHISFMCDSQVKVIIGIRNCGKNTYIQSVYSLPAEEKTEIENKSLALTGASFPKIIVRHDSTKRWYDDNGILNIGVIDF